MNLKIEKIGINGEGIAYFNHQPVFIEGALVGEVVEVKITEKQKKYAKAKLIKIIEKSKDRVHRGCKYATKCGACSLMHTKYEKQLEYKFDLLKQSLIKYAQVNPKLIRPLIKNDQPFSYRNSFKLPFAMEKNQLVCGLYMPNTNYFVPVEDCIIHEKGLERIKKELLKVFNKHSLKAYNYKTKKGLRTLVVRGFQGSYQCCVVSGETPLTEECIKDCMQIEGLKSLWQSYHTTKKTNDLFGRVMIHLAGGKSLEFELGSLQLTLSPKSFFQLNTGQAEKLYDLINGMIMKGNDLIVEAYSGIGAISLYVKDKAKEIIGIEYISDAVRNANQNAKKNHASHVHFVCDDAAEKLTTISKKRKIDVLIVDPPRSGLDDAMINCIMKSKIKEVIYISCNPATLGKNLAILKQLYEIKQVIPVDMFSNTPLVESIVKLVRKK